MRSYTAAWPLRRPALAVIAVTAAPLGLPAAGCGLPGPAQRTAAAAAELLGFGHAGRQGELIVNASAAASLARR
jgi:hypothetical protein